MRARIHFLVKDLIDELENEQIQLGTGAHLRLQELLRLLPDDISDADLLLALAPLLARSGREQELIYEKFALCQRRANEVFDPRPVDVLKDPRPINPIEQKIKNSKRWLWVAVALLAVVLAGLFWKFYAVEKTTLVEKSFAVNAGKVASICLAALPELDSLGGRIARLELKFIQNDAPDTARSRQPGSAWAGSSALADYYVQNDTCLLVAARDSVQAMDSLVLNVLFSNQKKVELRLRIKIESQVRASPDIVSRPQISLSTWLHANWYWVYLAIFGSFCALFFILWNWWVWRQRKLYAQLERKEKPPYVWNVEIPGVEALLLDDAYRHALQVMRRRRQSVAQRLDMERTIAATVEQGGLPRFQYCTLSQQVDYLLLLDRQQTGNHHTQLFDAFYRAFRAQELAIERYFYDSDLRLCFSEAQPGGIRLAELAQRFVGARLVMVGSGLQLIHPLSGGLVAWADLFEHWPQRLLLSPRHPEEWGRNERLLGTLFRVLPATLSSLSFWVEELEQGEDAHFERWQERVTDVPAAVFQPDEAHPLATLLLQFPREVVHWVAACAIYPSLHWDLTLWFGQQLQTHNGEPLLEHITLLRLFRIRWFVVGQMPQTAREQLLEWLDGEDPGLVPTLRRALAAILAQSPPPEDSMAWVDHRLQLVFNRWMSESTRKEKKKYEKELVRLLPQADADFVALKFLNELPTPLHFEVLPDLKKYVYREYWQEVSIFNRTKKRGSIQEKNVMEPTAPAKENPITNSNTAPLKTFIIFSRKDEALKNELTLFLSNTLIKSGHLSVWHDGDILAIEEWEKKEEQNLGESEILLVLLSVDTLNSEMQQEDLRRALTRTDKIIPVLVRPCDWESHSLFKSLQGLPKNMKPVSLFSNHDDAWIEVIVYLKKIVEEIWDKQKEVSQTGNIEKQNNEAEEERKQKTIGFKNLKHANAFAEMVFVKGGTFQIDSTYEGTIKPSHDVSIDDFLIGKYPVTQKQWQEIMGNNPSKFKNDRYLPVECVSWDDTHEFLRKLNEKYPECNYRLPTEFEWEYAARGGNQTKGYKYSGSNKVDEVAWYYDNSNGETHIVGGKKANELGIYDMSGNIYEWCQDVWHENYQGAPSNGSAWISGSDQSRRVLRGGSWNDLDSYCCLRNRSRNYSPNWNEEIGFRLARNP